MNTQKTLRSLALISIFFLLVACDKSSKDLTSGGVLGPDGKPLSPITENSNCAEVANYVGSLRSNIRLCKVASDCVIVKSNTIIGSLSVVNKTSIEGFTQTSSQTKVDEYYDYSFEGLSSATLKNQDEFDKLLKLKDEKCGRSVVTEDAPLLQPESTEKISLLVGCSLDAHEASGSLFCQKTRILKGYNNLPIELSCINDVIASSKELYIELRRIELSTESSSIVTYDLPKVLKEKGYSCEGSELKNSEGKTVTMSPVLTL